LANEIPALTFIDNVDRAGSGDSRLTGHTTRAAVLLYMLLK